MKSFKQFATLVFCAGISFSACKKDESTPPPPPPPTGNTFTDTRDGQIYRIVNIGNKSNNGINETQTWFAENLNYESSDSWWYNNDEELGVIYGRLYTWGTAMNACPAGWHLPSDEEWKIMEMSLGMSQTEADDSGIRGTDQGYMLKDTGSTYWGDFNEASTNSSGFTALPGGNRDSEFFELGTSANWWTATEFDDFLQLSWSRSISFVGGKITRDVFFIGAGFSVRCVKD